MMVPINAARLEPEAAEARHRVCAILANSFQPAEFEPAVHALASRQLYPAAADFLAGIVAGKGAPGRHLLVAHLLEIGVSCETRCRRIAGDIGLISRSESTHSYAFGFADLCAATAVAPLAWLALACLGYARGEDGRPYEFRLGDPFPPTKRALAGVALHHLCARAKTLRRGAS